MAEDGRLSGESRLADMRTHPAACTPSKRQEAPQRGSTRCRPHPAGTGPRTSTGMLPHGR